MLGCEIFLRLLTKYKRSVRFLFRLCGLLLGQGSAGQVLHMGRKSLATFGQKVQCFF